MKKVENAIWIVVILGVLFLVFYAGSSFESARMHRRECTLTGGVASGLFSEECYFDSRYDESIRERLDRSCPTGKGWYIYNDADTHWRHKCG